MRLEVVIPEVKAQRFDCHGCTDCCRDLVVQLTPRDRKAIDRQGWEGRLEDEPYVPLGRQGFVLNHKASGGCIFLRDNRRCAIHAEHGATEKPLACQLYPFTLQPDIREASGSVEGGRTWRAGLRFDCPSVARSAGGPLGRNRAELARLAARLAGEAAATFQGSARAVELVAGHSLSSDELEDFVNRLDGWLRDTDRPLLQRLAGLHDLTQTLQKARLGRLEGGQLAEFVELLTGDLAAAAEAAEPSLPPTAKQLRLLRLTVFSHGEHVRFEQARAPMLSALSHRFGQVRRAWRLHRAAGELPTLSIARSACTLAALDAVQPADGRAADELLTRYLRMRVLGDSAFGPGYYGWSIVDGLSALILAVAAIGWMARYAAAAGGRKVLCREDLVRAVGFIDRTAGRAPELGRATSRLRVRYLQSDGGIMRLAHAYRVA